MIRLPRIRFARNVDTYKPRKTFNPQIIIFWLGFVYIETEDEIKEIEAYDFKNKTVYKTKGYVQRSTGYDFIRIKNKFSIVKEYPYDLWNI